MGGQSLRMGTDKSHLKVNEKYLYQIAAEKLKPYCQQIILSVNAFQAKKNKFEYPTIIDIYKNEGPISGILSCYDSGHSNIFLLAADLAAILSENLQDLLAIHQPEKDQCTMFYNDKEGYFEPLLSIWEEPALTNLKIYFDQGGRSLQKFLIGQNIQKYPLKDYQHFKNINTPDDFNALKTTINEL